MSIIRLLKNFVFVFLRPRNWLEFSGFKIDMSSNGMFDVNSRIIAEIEEDHSLIPFFVALESDMV